jgi:[methyl-Co(III) methanol-specific corrinoid protein]:coenzyme M methyltransferase
MDMLSPKERLLGTLKKKTVDRPPVICPGGMMNAAIVDVMKTDGHTLPDGHRDPAIMSGLSLDVQTRTGFENIGVPFCMTVEAEVLGSGIDFGSLECEPKIKKEKYSSVRDFEFRDVHSLANSGRIPTVNSAIYSLAKQNADIPVIGSLTGPISTAASLVDPMTFLKELRKENKAAHGVLEYVSDFLVQFALQMVESGASVISIADPTATGEILGPKMFEEFAVRYINRVTEEIHRTGTPVIVHICGKLDAVKKSVPGIHSEAISTDAMVSLRQLKEEYPEITTMGNLSTYTLEFGNPDKISENVKHLIGESIDIIAPACGLSTSTPLENIRAMTGTVKEHPHD